MVWLKRDSLTTVDSGRVADTGRQRPATGAARTAEVIANLRQGIETGRYPPESRLPPERTLAEELGVGRALVREAIKVLSALGLVESRRGSGTYVLPTAPGGPAEPAVPRFTSSNLLEVRKLLEPRAAWLAATRATEQQLLEIEWARQRLELHDRDWKLAAQFDVEFHEAIFRAAQNPALEWIHRFVMTQVLETRTTGVQLFGDVERMRKDHRAIVEAILRRQPDAAEQAAIAHLDAAARDLIVGAIG